ncbi:MAG: 4Fe-4S binding protein [Proteobacteria bacterium]|nr:4Fe-4S binding protein [Pseudomonadota bacterium]
MGHLVGKDVYTELGKTIDRADTRAPYNPVLAGILKELYSPQEAELVARMPLAPATFETVRRTTGYDRATLERMLAGLCEKGLVMDLWIEGDFRYMISPFMIGVYEFTMMRTGPDVDSKTLAGMFREYLEGDDAFFKANCDDGQQVAFLRALPHEEALAPRAYTEVLDHEKARVLVESADLTAIGLCSCRHEKVHTGRKECDAPLEICASFGPAADYLIRNGMARRVPKGVILDNLDRARELGLVLETDNVRRNTRFLCFCCGCCCNMLLGLTRYGYPNFVMTSNFMARVDEKTCSGCGKCAAACPIQAIETAPAAGTGTGRTVRPVVDESICLGCGVCGLSCPTGALRLHSRPQRVLLPETTFHRVVLQALERDNLQNFLFDNPHSRTHAFARGLAGSFLKLGPVKKALMSEALRSRFLSAVEAGVTLLGKGWARKV